MTNRFMKASLFLVGLLIGVSFLIARIGEGTTLYSPFQGGKISGPILAPLSNCIDPPYSFAGTTTTGFASNGSQIVVCVQGIQPFNIGIDGFRVVLPLINIGKLSNGSSGNGFSRLFLGGGTSLVAGDFGSIAGACGSTASISAVSGTDSRGTVSLTSAGVGQASNTCTFTLTFHDGTFTNAPFVSAGVTGTLPAVPVAISVLSSTATTAVFEIIGLPVAASVYSFWFNTIG